MPNSSHPLRILTLPEAVRRRPGMYFGVPREDPAVMAAVARTAAMEPFQLAGNPPVRVRLTIESGTSFTLEDDLPPLTGADGRPEPGFYGSLIDSRRGLLAAAAAVSVQTTIEVRAGGRAWRTGLASGQQMRDRDVTGYPGEDEPALPLHQHRTSAPDGTKATLTLDTSWFPPGACLPADASEIAPGPDAGPLPGTLTIIDRRSA